METIQPKSEQEWLELRVKDITSSEVAALFNLSPYMTQFELWHRKKDGKVVANEMDEWTTWGQRLQDSIAAGVAQDNGWVVRKMTEYMRDPVLRAGASFDFSIEEMLDGRQFAASDIGMDGRGLLEIKNVFGMIFKDQWLEDEDGNIEAPPHIELQVQHQLMISKRDFAYIAALVSGNKIELIKRTPNPIIIEEIKARVTRFWDSIEANQPPQPNFEKDSDFISSLFGYSEPGKTVDGRGDAELSAIAAEYKEASEVIKHATAVKEAAKSKILMMIGDAEKVLGDGFSVSAGMVGPCPIAYTRDGYRLFKINWPRGKKKE